MKKLVYYICISLVIVLTIVNIIIYSKKEDKDTTPLTDIDIINNLTEDFYLKYNRKNLPIFDSVFAIYEEENIKMLVHSSKIYDNDNLIDNDCMYILTMSSNTNFTSLYEFLRADDTNLSGVIKFTEYDFNITADNYSSCFELDVKDTLIYLNFNPVNSNRQAVYTNSVFIFTEENLYIYDFIIRSNVKQTLDSMGNLINTAITSNNLSGTFDNGSYEVILNNTLTCEIIDNIYIALKGDVNE